MLSSRCALQFSLSSLCALQVEFYLCSTDQPEFYLCSTGQPEFYLCFTGQPDPELPAPSAGGPGGSDEDHLHRAPLLPLLRRLTVPVGIHLLEVLEEVMRVRGQGSGCPRWRTPPGGTGGGQRVRGQRSGVRGQNVPGSVHLLEVLQRVRGSQVTGQRSGVGSGAQPADTLTM